MCGPAGSCGSDVVSPKKVPKKDILLKTYDSESLVARAKASLNSIYEGDESDDRFNEVEQVLDEMARRLEHGTG